MLTRTLARLTTAQPSMVLVTMAALTAVALMFSPGLTERLSGQGFVHPGSESNRALDALADVTDIDVRGEFVALIEYGKPVNSAGGRRIAGKIVKRFEDDPDIAVVYSPFDGRKLDRSLISRDGKSAIVTANLKPHIHEGDAFERMRDPIDSMAKVRFGGGDAAMHTVTETIERDLKRAEMIGFPLLFVIALFVFRGLIAALLPLLVGGITIIMTFALIRLFDGITDLSVFALNLTTGLGLGLAIDYSLLLVTRFREEVAAGADTREAVRRTVGTAGKTVGFSAMTVAAALGAMTIFPLKFLYSMGIGGATVALVAATVALTIVPALLMLLGPRIDRLAIPRRSAEYSVAQWHRLAEWVMKRPAVVAVATTGLLVLLTLPATNIEFTSVDATVLGKDASPRIVQEAVNNDFPRNDANGKLWVLLQSDRYDPVAVGRDARKIRRSANALQRDQAQLQAESIALRSGASGGSPVQLQAESESLQKRAERLDARKDRLQRRVDRLERFTDRIEDYTKRIKGLVGVEDVGKLRVMGKGTWRFEVYPQGALYSKSAQQVVKEIRSLDAPADRKVGGPTAGFVDQRHSILERTPLALALIAAVTFIVLFLMTGSVILPIKTFIMNLLTLGATFGVLVWIFQDGRFENILRYEGQGALEMTQPVLLFAIAFGLATDYGVFLLSRIKELHDDGESDHDAVANGVARTGRVITSAAILFCVAIVAFSTSGIVFIKELGVGAALAVAIDASIVRVMLVPALMALLGRWNWWAPGPLRRLHDRFGISEGPSAGRPVAGAVPIGEALVVQPTATRASASDAVDVGGSWSKPFVWGDDEPDQGDITFLDADGHPIDGQLRNGNGNGRPNGRGPDGRSGLTIGIVWTSRGARSWHMSFNAGRNKPQKKSEARLAGGSKREP